MHTCKKLKAITFDCGRGKSCEYGEGKHVIHMALRDDGQAIWMNGFLPADKEKSALATAHLRASWDRFVQADYGLGPSMTEEQFDAEVERERQAEHAEETEPLVA